MRFFTTAKVGYIVSIAILVMGFYGCTPKGPVVNEEIVKFISNSNKALGCRGCEPEEGEAVEGEAVEGETVEGEWDSLIEPVLILVEQFETADTNDDDQLSYEEVVVVVPGLTAEQFEELDSNGNGQLTQEELGSVLTLSLELRDDPKTMAPNYVNILFQAFDSNGIGVTDLDTSRLALTEDGAAVSPTESNTEVRKQNRLPYTFYTVLMLDNSASVGDSLGTIRDAAKALVNNMGEKQRIAVYSFSNEASLILDFTDINGKQAILDAIDSMDLGFPSTNLYGAVIDGVGKWENRYDLDEITQGALVLFTDGSDTQGLHTLEEALDTRGEKRCYTIGLGSEINPDALEQLGNAGYYPVSDIAALSEVFAEIQLNIDAYADSFYLLRYNSPKRGDNNHTLTLQAELPYTSNTLEGSFNSADFYDVMPGVYVNDGYDNHEGIAALTFTGGAGEQLTLSVHSYFGDTSTDPIYACVIGDETICRVISNEDGTIVIEALSHGTTTLEITDTVNNFSRTLDITVLSIIPDVYDMTESEATTALAAAGLTVGEITYEVDDSVASGNVLSQSISSGEAVAPGTTVTLTVAQYVVVPNVYDLPEAEAIATLEAAGLTVGEITYSIDDSVASGNVLSQSIGSGRSVVSGTTVTLMVAQYVIVPEVYGLPETEAIATLTAAGLTVGEITYVVDNTVTDGNVLSIKRTNISSVSSGGDAQWNPCETKEEGCYQSGGIDHNEESWLELTISGPFNAYFMWKVSSEEYDDHLKFYINGNYQQSISGDIDWQRYDVFENGTENVLRWEYEKDEGHSSGNDAGWVNILSLYELEGMTVMPETIVNLMVAQYVIVPDVYDIAESEAVEILESAGLIIGNITYEANDSVESGNVLLQTVSDPCSTIVSVLSGGDMPWESCVSQAGNYCYRSGDINDNEGSWLDMTIVGPGNFYFMWKVDSQNGKLIFYINDEFQDNIQYYVDWTLYSFSVGSGENVLRWSYVQDNEHYLPYALEDCGWVDVSGVCGSSSLPVVPDSVIDLTVAQYVVVPDVYDMTESEAIAAIEANKLEVDISYVFDDRVASGNVLAQSFSPGTAVDIGSTVTINVAQYVVVPDVYDMTESEAIATLTEAGLTVGEITYVFDNQVASGNVISQGGEYSLSINTGGSASWIPCEIESETCYQSGRIGHNEETWLEMVIQGPGEFFFMWKLLYDGNPGFLKFYINGDLQEQLNGDNDWIQYPFTINTGIDVLRWSYSKPSDITYSEDAGLIDIGGIFAGIPTELIAGTVVEPGTVVEITISLGWPENIMLPGDVPLELVPIPAGTFIMGRYSGEQHSQYYEDPQHEVMLTQDIYLGKYELTKRQWEAVMGTTPWSEENYVLNDLDSPAVYVSWNDAQSFITALNTYITNTGQGSATFRLPTEAEWEYACRAGTATRFYWGDDSDYTQIDEYAWWSGNAWNASEQYAHVVGLKLPNAFGLYDMIGNVWEWCEDDWHSSYTEAPNNGSAWMDSPRSSYRLLRGGAWHSSGFIVSGSDCRSASRSNSNPDRSVDNGGFRVLRTP